MKEYLVTYELMRSSIGIIEQNMTHIVADPNGDLLKQMYAELAKKVLFPVFVFSYEEEINDDYLIYELVDYCI